MLLILKSPDETLSSAIEISFHKKYFVNDSLTSACGVGLSR